jgi:hypothetical protein
VAAERRTAPTTQTQRAGGANDAIRIPDKPPLTGQGQIFADRVSGGPMRSSYLSGDVPDEPIQ